MSFPTVVIKLPRSSAPRERIMRSGRMEFLYYHIFSETLDGDEFNHPSVSVWGFSGDQAEQQAKAFATQQAAENLDSTYLVCNGHTVISVAPGSVCESQWTEKGLLPV